MEAACKMAVLATAEEGLGCTEDPAGEFAGDSMEGIKSGDDAGESSKPGTGETGETWGAGVEAAGAGDPAGEAEDASTSTSIFIPCEQWPIAPQMKYLLPGAESGTAVLPPL